MSRLIRNIFQNKSESEPDIIENKQKEFQDGVKHKAKEILNKGLEISFSDRIKGAFKIGPKEGGYLISFTDEDFDNFFRAYLRPRLIEMLYESK